MVFVADVPASPAQGAGAHEALVGAGVQHKRRRDKQLIGTAHIPEPRHILDLWPAMAVEVAVGHCRGLHGNAATRHGRHAVGFSLVQQGHASVAAEVRRAMAGSVGIAAKGATAGIGSMARVASFTPPSGLAGRHRSISCSGRSNTPARVSFFGSLPFGAQGILGGHPGRVGFG